MEEYQVCKYQACNSTLFNLSADCVQGRIKVFSMCFSMEEYRVCNPSRHEVLRLLWALHEARQGRNMNKIIQLCNRVTSASDIDTNIRFLG